MSKQKIQVPKGYKPSKIEKIGRPTGVTEEQILTWHALKSLEENKMLPKGYLTKVRNNRISYESARKYATRTLIKAGCPFKMRLCIRHNNYYVITFIKLA
jgi:hypothetical protein